MPRFCFYGSESREYEKHAIEGLRRLGMFDLSFRLASNPDIGDFDGAVVYGLQKDRKSIFNQYRDMNKPVIFFDKCYISTKTLGGRNAGVRVSVNATQPTQYFESLSHSYDRLLQHFNVDNLKPPMKKARHILLCGSSERYHAFNNLPDPWDYNNRLIAKIRKKTDSPIKVRFKPKIKLSGTMDDSFDRVTLDKGYHIRESLSKCSLLITHGSGAAVNAIQHGVPVCVLGDHPASLMGIDYLSVKKLKYPTLSRRMEWFSRLFQCQWGFEELSGNEFKSHLSEALKLNGYNI